MTLPTGLLPRASRWSGRLAAVAALALLPLFALSSLNPASARISSCDWTDDIPWAYSGPGGLDADPNSVYGSGDDDDGDDDDDDDGFDGPIDLGDGSDGIDTVNTPPDPHLTADAFPRQSDLDYLCDTSELVEATVRVESDPEAFEVYRNGETIWFKVYPDNSPREPHLDSQSKPRPIRISDNTDHPYGFFPVQVGEEEDIYYATYHDMRWEDEHGWVADYYLTVKDPMLDLDGIEALPGGMFFAANGQSDGHEQTAWGWNPNGPRRHSSHPVGATPRWFLDFEPDALDSGLETNLMRVSAELLSRPYDGRTFGLNDPIYIAVVVKSTLDVRLLNRSLQGHIPGSAMQFDNAAGSPTYPFSLGVRVKGAEVERCEVLTKPRGEQVRSCETFRTADQLVHLPLLYEQYKPSVNGSRNYATGRWIFRLNPNQLPASQAIFGDGIDLDAWIPGLSSDGIEIVPQFLSSSRHYARDNDRSDTSYLIDRDYVQITGISRQTLPAHTIEARLEQTKLPLEDRIDSLPGPGPDPDDPVDDITIPHPQPIEDDEGAGIAGQPWYINPDPSTIPSENAFYHGDDDGVAGTPAIGGGPIYDHGGGQQPDTGQPPPTDEDEDEDGGAGIPGNPNEGNNKDPEPKDDR